MLFHDTIEPANTELVSITDIHGNFYSNPFYMNFGVTLNLGGIDFIYAQTCDAFGQIKMRDCHTEECMVIGSQTEYFKDTLEDVKAYVDWAEQYG